MSQKNRASYNRMTSKQLHPVMQEMRAYVTSGDESRYDGLPEGFVRIDVTHSNLNQRWHDILLWLDSSVLEIKEKLYRKGGSVINSMELFLRGGSLGSSVLLDDDCKSLRYYGCKNGCEIHIKDSDPYSVSAGGALENLDLVEKYVMADDHYDKRDNTLRAYIKKQRAADPNFKLKFLGNNEPASCVTSQRPETPDNIKDLFKIGDRCEVQPGQRRGEIAFVGKIKGVTYVGVRLDEPQGHNEGKGPDGVKYFETKGPGYGCFARHENVQVGDFPERDPFASDSSADEI